MQIDSDEQRPRNNMKPYCASASAEALIRCRQALPTPRLDHFRIPGHRLWLAARRESLSSFVIMW
jgi:hypothetical protein